MSNKKEIQTRINRRLSGLSASEKRRMDIWAKINAERQAARPIKRTIPKVLVLTLVAVLLMAAAAIAEYFNLFNFFGEQEPRYNAIAPDAVLTTSEPVVVEHPELGTVSAAIDSAYFDGRSLNLAFRIPQGMKVEEYKPTDEELTRMNRSNTDIPSMEVSENEPGADILHAWNHAVKNGIPYGCRKTSIYASDHTLTEDGIDLCPDSVNSMYNENGEFCEMRDFEDSLPEEIRSRQELKVNIAVRQEVVCYWFDGTTFYWHTERTEIEPMTATIPRNDQIRQFSGKGTINGIVCDVRAEVSPMASVLTFNCAAPLNTFLHAVSEGSAENCWVEAIVLDNNGTRLSLQDILPLDGQTSFTLSFLGTGTLPSSMTIYLYAMQGSMDEPDLTTLDRITMQVDQQIF